MSWKGKQRESFVAKSWSMECGEGGRLKKEVCKKERKREVRKMGEGLFKAIVPMLEPLC